METNPTADESTPAATGAHLDEQPSEPTGQADAEETAQALQTPAGPGDDALLELADRAKAGRLPATDEERATVLVKEALLDGRTGINRAVAALPKLPWIVGVRAVETAWPEMKATAKTQLLKGLAESAPDGARRVRLSLARALFKQDVPIALKIAVGVTREMREPDTDAISPRNAQIFANVFIGKAKPWLGQLPLAELKPADADSLIHCAILAVFSLAHPPLTQLGVLKWAAESGRLGKLNELAMATAARVVSRWSAKWQTALREEVAELPDQIAHVLRPGIPQASSEVVESTEGATPASAAVETERWEEATIGEVQAEAPQKKERPIYQPRPQKPETAAAGESRSRADRTEPRKERPQYQPRNAPAAAQNFNVSDALRQVEAHVQWLRSALNAAQAKLRDDDDARRGKRRPERGTTVVEGEPTAEELVRANQQLEGRIAELQQRVTDLMSDAEDRAASIGLASGDEAVDRESGLRTLLGLKLQENFQDFLALERELPGVVVQQHYKALLQEVFAVLRQEGIPLKA